MIVRNEESRLKACLEAATPWVDEICIVDTGSTDDTVRIARRMGARVERFEWRDDFARARNVSLEMATESWVLVLDADETLTSASGPAMREAICDPNAQAWSVTIDNIDPQGRITPSASVRLFRNRPEIRFNRPVYESVSDSLRALQITTVNPCDVHLHHVGTLPEVLAMTDRHSRNLAILKRRVAEEGEDVFSAYQLACSLRATADYDEAMDAWESAFQNVQQLPRAERRTYPWLPLMYDGYAEALVNEGDLTSALRVVTRGLADLPNAVELIWRRGDIAYRVGDNEAAGRYFRACFRPRAIEINYDTDLQSRTVRPAHGLARLAMDNRDAREAMRHIDRALRFDSDFYPAHCLAIRALLIMGDGEGATRRLDELLSTAPKSPTVRLLGGELAWMQRDTDAALELWGEHETVSEVGHRALCWVAVAEAASGDYEAAAARVTQIKDRDLGCAAARLMVAVITGSPYQRSNALRSARLLKGLIGWLRELLATEADDALDRFAVNAQHYAAEVPGIETLLSREDQAIAQA